MIINLILGSTRDESLGRRLFQYLLNRQDEFEKVNDVKFNFISLSDYNLPFFYESMAPMDNPNRVLKPNEQKWVDDMRQADGYIFLVPEYNHSFPAVLKNALDFLAFEAKGKPAKIITYSNNSRGGQFSYPALLPTLGQLGFFTLPKPTSVRNVDKNFGVDGNFVKDAPGKSGDIKKLNRAFTESAFYSKLFKEHPFKYDAHIYDK